MLLAGAALGLGSPVFAKDASDEAASWSASLADARWTGPMLAANAETLPRGRLYTEPYLFDVVSDGKHHPGSTAYIQYGLADGFTVGLLPAFAFATNGANPPIMAGDLKLLSQLRLTHFTPEHRVPTISFVLQARVPTGKYDRLERASRGQGSGAFATEIGFNVQHYFRLANGRLLRGRVNILTTVSATASVHGLSVYGTDATFRGHARPGDAISIDLAAEYSLTREWVLALDLVGEADGRTRISGHDASSGAVVANALAVQHTIAIAPAVEYNWSAYEGLLLGVRVIPRQRAVAASVTPALAFSKAW